MDISYAIEVVIDDVSQAFHHFCEAWDCVKERVHCFDDRSKVDFDLRIMLFNVKLVSAVALPFVGSFGGAAIQKRNDKW